MERPGHENCPCMETCPLNRALGLIGGKWKMQILCALSNNGPTRYNRLKKTLDGVSNTVLANALRELEEDGARPRPCPHPGPAGGLEHGPVIYRAFRSAAVALRIVAYSSFPVPYRGTTQR